MRVMTDYDLRVGDLVQLPARDGPYADDADWWWIVVSVDEWGALNVAHGHVRRVGVGAHTVRRVRRP
jgi:hypothetical protein